jgi:hypothetical protein
MMRITRKFAIKKSRSPDEEPRPLDPRCVLSKNVILTFFLVGEGTLGFSLHQKTGAPHPEDTLTLTVFEPCMLAGMNLDRQRRQLIFHIKGAQTPNRGSEKGCKSLDDQVP